jgi:hypothetical protein
MRALIFTICRYLGLFFFCLLLSFICYLSFAPNPVKQSPSELEIKIKNLYETAAVWVPHLEIDGGEIRSRYLSLFERIENGQQVNLDEGREYRRLYQSLLLEHQAYFSFFDSQLVAVTDLAMDQRNNVGSQGVEGHHDHHDESSRANFYQIKNSIAFLKESDQQKRALFSFARIKNAIFIYKNLNDILFHLATVPHTKSIAYHPLSGEFSAEQKIFEAMLQSFKAAQFMEVNSPEYQQKISSALDDYQQLVQISEELVHQQLTPFELKLVGSWGGWQSLTPGVSDRVDH